MVKICYSLRDFPFLTLTSTNIDRICVFTNGLDILNEVNTHCLLPMTTNSDKSNPTF